MKTKLFILITVICWLFMPFAHAACEDAKSDGTKIKLLAVTEDDRCYYTAVHPYVDPKTSKPIDGKLTQDDCKQIIPPDPQFYGVFFVASEPTLNLVNVCKVAKANE